jgi:hypothetical protein
MDCTLRQADMNDLGIRGVGLAEGEFGNELQRIRRRHRNTTGPVIRDVARDGRREPMKLDISGPSSPARNSVRTAWNLRRRRLTLRLVGLLDGSSQVVSCRGSIPEETGCSSCAPKPSFRGRPAGGTNRVRVPETRLASLDDVNLGPLWATVARALATVLVASGENPARNEGLLPA